MSIVSARASEPVAEEIVVESSRLDVRQGTVQKIAVEDRSVAPKPSLESALRGHSHIQVVPTPLKRSNLSLNGLSGEQVAISWDGDPILGRVDGALDARAVSLGTVDRIMVYQGLDSLPYGSENIAGVISLETPWELERRYRLESSAGSFGRTMLGARASNELGESRGGWGYSVAVANWRTGAIRAGASRGDETADTSSDASARFSASAVGSRKNLATLAGRDVDVRVGGSGFHEDASGVFSGEPSSGQQRRVHVFADARAGKSLMHVAYSEYRNRVSAVGADSFNEHALRFGPRVEEASGRFTVLGGATADLRSTSSTRIKTLAPALDPTGTIATTTFGAYAGTRYAASDHWLLGAGARWDRLPRGAGLWSPRGEVRYLFQTGAVDHVTSVEAGEGFRDPTPKEQYLQFSNPALRYRVVGNSSLVTEHGLVMAVRHAATTKRLTVRGSVFEMRVRDGIGYVTTADPGVFRYDNYSHAETYGAQGGVSYVLPESWAASADYQWLRGRVHDPSGNASEPFLQPHHRVSFSASRSPLRGLSLLGQAVWTGRQGFFDLNRNGRIDDGDWAPAFWMMTAEAGYGFRWSGVSELLRVFARVDNGLNVVHAESLPTEPRVMTFGAAVEL